MKHKFQELYEFHQKNRTLSTWAAQLTLEKASHYLHDEVMEVQEAIKKNDLMNLKEELGDVLSDVVMLMVIAEDKQYFTADDVLHDVVLKFQRRKPFVVQGRAVSLEEEKNMWEERKRQEKNESA